MFKKLVLAFAIFALAAAFAGTVPSPHSYRITLAQSAVVNGTELKPGEYRLTLDTTKITLVKGKQTVEVPANADASARMANENESFFNMRSPKKSLAPLYRGW